MTENKYRELLTDAQKSAFDIAQTADRPIAWLGAIRAGKTYGSAAILLDRMEKYPGNYIIAAYTYGNIERNILPPIEKIASQVGLDLKIKRSFPQNITINRDEFKSTAFMFSAQDVESQKTLQGMTARGALLDEVVLLPQNFVMQCVGRLSEDPPLLLLTANKSSPNSWVKTKWVDTGKVIEINNITADNPHISDTSKEWYESLLVGHYKSAMLENEWTGEYNVVADDPMFVDKLPKEDSLTRYFKCAYLTYARDCFMLTGYIVGDKICVEKISQMSAEEILTDMNEPSIHQCVINQTELDAGFGKMEMPLEIESWAQSLNRFGKKLRIPVSLRSEMSNTSAWVYKDDVKVEDISTEVLSMALLVHTYGQSYTAISME